MLQYAKAFLKTSLLFLSSMILSLLIGIIINWTFFITLEKNTWVQGASNTALGASTGVILTVLLGLLFFVGFPFLWLWVGRILGIQRALLNIFKNLKEPVVEFLSDSISRVMTQEQAKKLSEHRNTRYLAGQIMRLEKVPYGLKVLLPLIISKIPVELLFNLSEEMNEDPSQLKKAIVEAIDRYVVDELSSSWFLAAGLILLNVSAMALLMFLK